jgi:antitoxin (DNA-binding transcriptional repressor) of toxin-antitoxin stability system
MKTATVRDLRNNFARIYAWLGAGEEVEITRRGQLVARLLPAAKAKKPRVRFDAKARMKRLKEIYGGRTLPGNSVLLMREGKDW